jgi:type II secretory pathway pseudopilin PulG
MVVTILGLVAAIAIPRMSGAVTSATANSLEASLANVRRAIDVYYAEHDSYPGYDPSNGSPNGVYFVRQLLEFSDNRGRPNSAPTSVYRYGPYLRRPFPKNPFNGLDTVHVKANPGDADPADGTVGWVAVLSHGYFGVSATDSQFQGAGIDILDTVKKQVFRGKGMTGL